MASYAVQFHFHPPFDDTLVPPSTHVFCRIILKCWQCLCACHFTDSTSNTISQSACFQHLFKQWLFWWTTSTHTYVGWMDYCLLTVSVRKWSRQWCARPVKHFLPCWQHTIWAGWWNFQSKLQNQSYWSLCFSTVRSLTVHLFTLSVTQITTVRCSLSLTYTIRRTASCSSRGESCFPRPLDSKLKGTAWVKRTAYTVHTISIISRLQYFVARCLSCYVNDVFVSHFTWYCFASIRI
jgi:hypothetical protein